MTSHSRPLTVTVFGNHDELDNALGEELCRRGWRAHLVSVRTGWLQSAKNAIVRVDTESGASAIQELADDGHDPVHLVALCENRPDDWGLEAVRETVSECGARHDTSLMWHRPVDSTLLEPANEADTADRPVDLLASAIADEVSHQGTSSADPSFRSRLIDAQ